MAKFVDLTGKKFNKLTVIKRIKTRKNNMIYYLVRCHCGVEKEMAGALVSGGFNKTCGCSRRDWILKMNTTHGGTKSPLYKVWRGMKDRCARNSRYFGRDIKIEWKSFEEFRDDMLESYLLHKKTHSSTSIDRINNNGNYSKDNCRWVTMTENTRNRSNTIFVPYKGRRIPLSEYCETHKEVRYQTIIMRLWRGVPIEEAIKP